MKVKTFVCNEYFSCNVFVCSDERGTFIVDAGYYEPEIEEYLKTVPPVQFIIQTHCHFDHIMGLNELIKKYPEIKVYCHKEDIELAKDPRKNGSVLMAAPYIADCDFVPLGEGKNKIGDFEFELIHTPGHTKGSCMYYFADEKMLFTGDTIIGPSIGRTDLPTGSEADIYSSLEKIKKTGFSDDIKCFFGHGSAYSFADLRSFNPYIS